MTDDELDQLQETKPCETCGKDFTCNPYLMGIKFRRPNCGPCGDTLFAEHQAKEEALANAAKDERHEARWLELCPKLFRDTDANRINPALISAIAEWTHDRTGLAFIGTSGTGKTRAAFLALRKAFDAGLHCEATTHSALAQTARDAAFGERVEAARDRMEELQDCDVLFVDDLGKPPSTERADADFEALIDHRYSHTLPTIWTSNSGGAWLAMRFGDDRGKPIVRRLTEGALIVKL